MYYNHSCNVMPYSYGENFSFTDSEITAGKEGICEHKSYVETRFFFNILNNYNVQFMPYQDKDNSVQVSYILGRHRLTPILANYPILSFCRFFHDCHTKYTD